MEEHAAEPRPDGLDPQAALAERLKQLEDEARQLRDALGGGAALTPAPPEAVPDQADPSPNSAPAPLEEDFTPPPPHIQQQVENLIRRARIEGQRGQAQLASKLIEEARTLAPNSPDVLEIVGDDLVAKGRRRDAAKYYERAFRISKNPNHERKWGSMIVSTDASSVELAQRMNESDAVANPKIAMILSIAIPWLGQIVTGQYQRGGIFLGLYIVMWIWAFATPNGIPSLLALAGVRTGVSGSHLNIIVMVPLAAALIIHFVGIFDAASRAKNAERKLHDRPRPPVDLPFD